MKAKLVILLLAAGLLSLPWAAHADDLGQKLSKLVQPGQWETTSTINMSVVGTNMALPARTTTSKQCIKKGDIKDLASPDIKNMDCDMTRKELTGNVLHLAMTCSGQKGTFTLKGSTTFVTKTSTTLHFLMTGKMSGMNMKVVMDGKSRRTGDCTKPNDD